jgi:hypothetical protein
MLGNDCASCKNEATCQPWLCQEGDLAGKVRLSTMLANSSNVFSMALYKDRMPGRALPPLPTDVSENLSLYTG